MTDLFRFLQDYENAIYFLLGLGAILYAYRFWNAWDQMRVSVYGLEKEVARQELNRAAVYLFLVFIIGVFVFATVSITGSMVELNALSPTATLELVGELPPGGTPGADNQQLFTPTPLPTVHVNPDHCEEGRIDISSPAPGEVVRGELTVTGTVNVESFGFFQVEYARAQDGLWLPISVKHNIVINGDLATDWDTSNIPPGDYILQLLVTDNNGGPYDPCRIPIRIEAAG